MKIRYSRVKPNGRRYWYASRALQALGFRDVPCGREGPAAQAKALRLTAAAVKALASGDTRMAAPSYTRGTVGHLVAVYETSKVFRLKSAANREKLRNDHKVILQHIGDTRLSDLTEDDVIAFSEDAGRENGAYSRWHAMKALKVLLKRAASRKVIAFNPAEDVPNPQPKGRSETWRAEEVPKLIQGARDLQYTALSLCLELMDFCGFQPVDARTLTRDMLYRVGPVCVIDRRRAKTGAKGLWAIPEDLMDRIEDYIKSLGATPLPDAPLFRRHVNSDETGQPLTWRNQREFARDFRDVREHVFGRAETRKAMDIRRSVSVDTDLAGLSKEERATMLANSIDRNPALHKVYTPASIEAAVRALEKRIEGRSLRTKQDAAMEFSIEPPSADGTAGSAGGTQ